MPNRRIAQRLVESYLGGMASMGKEDSGLAGDVLVF
jgi:hypothetical protein